MTRIIFIFLKCKHISMIMSFP